MKIGVAVVAAPRRAYGFLFDVQRGATQSHALQRKLNVLATILAAKARDAVATRHCAFAVESTATLVGHGLNRAKVFATARSTKAKFANAHAIARVAIAVVTAATVVRAIV